MILRSVFIPSDDKSIFHDRILDGKHHVVAEVYDLHEQHYTKLFIAAPDLLEACQRVSDAVEDGQAMTNPLAFIEDAHDILQKAIKESH